MRRELISNGRSMGRRTTCADTGGVDQPTDEEVVAFLAQHSGDRVCHLAGPSEPPHSARCEVEWAGSAGTGEALPAALGPEGASKLIATRRTASIGKEPSIRANAEQRKDRANTSW
jgi:hypothetical protein